jgi:phage baseplate assembly protein V
MRLPFKYGIVSDVSRPGYAKVYFAEDDIVTKWWPVLQRNSLVDKESWPLNVQEHVICLCDDRVEEGVVLGAVFNDEDTPDAGAGPGKFRKVFEDGTILEYDKSTHKFSGTIKGDVDIIADGDASISTDGNLSATAAIKATITAPSVEITGNVSITGNLTFGGTLAGGAGGSLGFDGSTLTVPSVHASADVKAGAIDLKTHVHSGVQTGSGSSGPPLG